MSPSFPSPSRKTGRRNNAWDHVRCSRRAALQAGAIGILGLGVNHLQGLRESFAADGIKPRGSAKSCIFIFLSGGLAQQDSFDMKPDAPEIIRGEFRPINTQTPGIQICEHLPMLAARSDMWALCRSLTHGSNEHSAAHHIMLTGQSTLPTGFKPDSSSRSDSPSITSIAGRMVASRNNLPSAVVLPERLVHSSGRIIPGQHAGVMGAPNDPWLFEASPFQATAYGAYPEFSFDHQDRDHPDERLFQAPQLTLPAGLGMRELSGRLQLLETLRQQRDKLHASAQVADFDRLRQGAISMLTETAVHEALDVTNADSKTLDRYGRNSFGWSLLMARRLVSAGVNLVQVNLGNDETWDTHGNAFPHLKDNLFPPTDRALSALLDDLKASGELDETLIVMAGEFGRTPQISLLEKHYKLPGRDHWGAVQSVFFAGGGLRGGNVVGKTDAHAGYPIENPVKPENFAATIYDALGIPATAAWHDAQNRPHHIYQGEPIAGLI